MSQVTAPLEAGYPGRHLIIIIRFGREQRTCQCQPTGLGLADRGDVPKQRLSFCLVQVKFDPDNCIGPAMSCHDSTGAKPVPNGQRIVKHLSQRRILSIC